MAPREDEAVAVQPFGGSRIIAKTTCAVEYRADFGTTEREAKVPRTAGMDSIDR